MELRSHTCGLNCWLDMGCFVEVVRVIVTLKHASSVSQKTLGGGRQCNMPMPGRGMRRQKLQRGGLTMEGACVVNTESEKMSLQINEVVRDLF